MEPHFHPNPVVLVAAIWPAVLVGITVPELGHEFERWCFDVLGGAIQSGTPALPIGISDVTHPVVIT